MALHQCRQSGPQLYWNNPPPATAISGDKARGGFARNARREALFPFSPHRLLQFRRARVGNPLAPVTDYQSMIQ
jgi:hypothetical protein